MAIQKSLQFKGLDVGSAYIEIIHIGSHKEIPSTHIGYRVWKDATKTNMLEMQGINLPYDPDMTVKKAYTTMKQMPEFTGAIDV